MNISKRMLNMTAEYYNVSSINADRKPVYSESITLNNIYISTTDAITEGTNGRQTADSLTLVFDCLNSTPENFKPVIGAKVVFNSKNYFIKSVIPAYGLSGLEHYSVVLS